MYLYAKAFCAPFGDDRRAIRTRINTFLNENQNVDFNQYRTNFNWEGANYECYATCLFVVRE
jgi:hypothetical protein